MKVYVVTKSWGNGEAYDDRRENYDGYLKTFLTKEKAIDYINNTVKEATAPYEFEEPEHNEYYDENVKYLLEEVRTTVIESEILRNCFSWNDSMMECRLDTAKAYDMFHEAKICSEILHWDIGISDRKGWITYEIIEEEAE